MIKKQKLELTWIGKDEEVKLEPRVLVEDHELSYGDKDTQNLIIHGDNLLALKALEQDYSGKIKCIYINPPYNTGNAFEHYDDGLEHSIWLNLMRSRLTLLRNLLSDDGSIWISIDADESHYLKVLCDEIFGRLNFVDEVIWQRAYSPINLKKTLSRSHDTILVYAKNSNGFTLNKLPRTAEANKRYKNLDNDPRGVWKSGDLSVGPAVEKNIYEITTPSGRVVLPPKGYSWRLSQERLAEYIDDNRIWFGPDGKSVPSIKRFLSEVKDGVTPMEHFHYEPPKFEQVSVNPFVKIEQHNFTKFRADSIHDFNDTIEPASLIKMKVFSGFKKACHNLYKFDSKTEKDFAIILEQDKNVQKWLRPASNQFRIYWNHNSKQYEPDFIVETEEFIYMVETKKADDIKTDEVQDKKRAALQYCNHASKYAKQTNGKEWRYMIMPHDKVAFNNDFCHLANSFLQQ